MGRQIPLRLWSWPSITMVEFIVCVSTTSQDSPRRSTCRTCTDCPVSLTLDKYSQIRRFFHATQAQAEGGFKSIAELYSEARLDGLWEGENAEIAGMERILEHWRDLDYREPTLKIICPHDYSRKRFGLFVDGCPNLLWELMRTRREQLTASQLMRKNPTEAIVDKDNHLRDALKYILLSLPSPSEKPPSQERDDINSRGICNGKTWLTGCAPC